MVTTPLTLVMSPRTSSVGPLVPLKSGGLYELLIAMVEMPCGFRVSVGVDPAAKPLADPV